MSLQVEKLEKNIQYLLTWYVYGYIVIATKRKDIKEHRNERIRF